MHGPPRRFAIVPAVVGMVALVCWSGCVARGRLDLDRVRLGGVGSQAQAAAQRVHEARGLIEEHEYTLAVPHLLTAVVQYPETPAALDARFLLGVVHSELGNYRDAMNVFEGYLELAPEGAHAAEARTYLERVREEYSKRFLTSAELDAKVRRLAAVLEAEPGDAASQYALADLLWQRGNYKEAGKLYAHLRARQSAYAKRELVLSRIEWLPDGRYVVLTPAERERREAEKRPLVIFNQHSFRSGREWLTQERLHYVVTGQVMNRSDSVLYGVQVNVTVYGFGNVVYDTATAHIGRLNPRERRAFSVRFSEIEYGPNLPWFECEGTFQR